MDYIEFNNTFDILYNNITSNQAPGLNVYEKSVLLTKAEHEVLKNYFNPKGNKYQEGYDNSPKRQIDFSTLTEVVEETVFETSLYDPKEESKSCDFPSDIMMVINERVSVTKDDGTTSELTVMPINFDEYNRLSTKPYKRPMKYQAWRLINNNAANKIDLIVGPGDTITTYTVRYVRKPKPIIIGNIGTFKINGYSWGGDTTPQVTLEDTIYGDNCCELDPSLHDEIVQRAVELAKLSWSTSEETQLLMTSGQRSE